VKTAGEFTEGNSESMDDHKGLPYYTRRGEEGYVSNNFAHVSLFCDAWGYEESKFGGGLEAFFAFLEAILSDWTLVEGWVGHLLLIWLCAQRAIDARFAYFLVIANFAYLLRAEYID
jgi:hypothetical protein